LHIYRRSKGMREREVALTDKQTTVRGMKLEVDVVDVCDRLTPNHTHICIAPLLAKRVKQGVQGVMWRRET